LAKNQGAEGDRTIRRELFHFREETTIPLTIKANAAKWKKCGISPRKAVDKERRTAV
jgi:hypothetical protein